VRAKCERERECSREIKREREAASAAKMS